MITRPTLLMWLIAISLGIASVWAENMPAGAEWTSGCAAGAAAVMSFVDVMLWRIGLGGK